MCQYRMNSDTNIISRRAFLKEFASLQRLKNKAGFQALHIFFQVDKRQWRLKSCAIFLFNLIYVF